MKPAIESHRKRNLTNIQPITGLGAGLAVSTFSRSLALIIGLMVVGIQARFPFLFSLLHTYSPLSIHLSIHSPIPPPINSKPSNILLQWASSHGLDIVPTDRIQRYIKHVNLRSLVEENVAFKVSFGTTFAMAAFMRF